MTNATIGNELPRRGIAMRPQTFRTPNNGSVHRLIAFAFLGLFSVAASIAPAQETPATAATPAAAPTPAEEAPKIPKDQLDSLVAPIALYPDSLLAQTLAASTYPLEIILMEQWLGKNKNLKGKELADAVAKQKWDPSVQSMAGIPDALKRLAGNIGWTTDLGNAFLSQPQDVMEAVQRMRAKAQIKGTLKTSQEQTVQTQKGEGNKEFIVIHQPNPEVVYVPSYDPAIVYGPPAYPYYPYTYPGYYPGMGLALGTGIVLGAAWANNWGNCNWNNGGDININNNNNFNRNNINNSNRNQAGGGKWQHQPSHRGGAPYSNRATANKYGSTSHRDSSNRQTTNRPSQQPARTDRSSDRTAGGDRQKPSTSDRSRANTPSNRPSGGDKMANRQVSRDSGPRTNNAFSSSGRTDRSSSFASSDRGS